MKNVLLQPEYRVTLVAASVIGAIALVAAGSLIWLHRVYSQSVREDAALAVLTTGRRIARQLANHPFVRDPQGTRGERRAFAELVRTVSSVESSIQYVSVTEAGEIDFHEQARPLDPSLPHPLAGPGPAGEVDVMPRLMSFGDKQIPLMTFTVHPADPEMLPRSLQIALIRDAVVLEGAGPSEAMGVMFRVAIITVSTALGVCVIVVISLVRREVRRQERRRTEEHLAFAGALADGVIHDMRNPMNSLRLDAQLLRKEALKEAHADPKRLAELAERMQGTVDRTDSVLTEFLYLSSPDSDSDEEYDLMESVHDCTRLLAPRFEKAEISVDVEGPDEKLSVQGRPVPIKRALVNVLVNAIQASPAQAGVEIRVTGTGGSAVIEVSDAGDGIEPGDRERVFEMFYSRRPGGTGLGLWMARTAVERQDGAIRVGDSSSGGAQIVITLPLSKEPRS